MNDSPVDCQNREWTEPQRDPRPPVLPPSDEGGGICEANDGGREDVTLSLAVVISPSVIFGNPKNDSSLAAKRPPFVTYGDISPA